MPVISTPSIPNERSLAFFSFIILISWGSIEPAVKIPAMRPKISGFTCVCFSLEFALLQYYPWLDLLTVR